jgi:Holliday junction resolvase RusA-like endonuclease
MLRIKIDGRAVAKERPRLTKYGGVFTPAKTVEYENKVAAAWNSQIGMLTLTGDLRVVIHVYTDRAGKQDVDNLAKSILDGLQKGGAFANDVQVKTLCITKHASDAELCTMVTIAHYDDH